MQFLIASTFTDSLTRLTNDEQKVVKTTAFDLQANPANPGLQFHKLDSAKDPNFWSVRVSRDIRIIVHKTAASLLLCYVDHHNKAYYWAERRKMETHPKTGAAQLVEIRETVKEITVPKYVEIEQSLVAKPALFANVSDEDLLKYGVPEEWLNDARNVNEDGLLNLADHLPSEAAEALLELATGGIPRVAAPPVTVTDPFEHPDAQRRFRTMSNAEELERALEYPWDKWTVFLHPMQRQLVDEDYNGPVRVSGSAGTGKTIVALHRAVYLARKYPDARVLLTTFSETLADALRTRLRRLISNEPRIGERLEVHSIEAVGLRLYEKLIGTPNLVNRETIRQMLVDTTKNTEGHTFSMHFLMTEWEQVVDAWQLDSWESYRDVKRLGRKTRLPEQKRALIWSVFEQVHEQFNTKKLITRAGLFSQLALQLANRKHPPFDYVVVDEAQDISVAQLRFIAALGGQRQNSLFFAGDLGQRIFQEPFSWKSLGIDIRGRSYTLHINYRTSHQIRMQADRLLGPEVADVDGNVEDRRGTVSVFNGQSPEIRILNSVDEEKETVATWLKKLISDDVLPHEIGVFVRSENELDRARAVLETSEIPYKILDEHIETTSGFISVCTMHLAKGLEFRAVAVMACDDEVIPLQSRIETVTDDTDLEEVYNTERHLLYVACTRARDLLLISSINPASEFLDDMMSKIPM